MTAHPQHATRSRILAAAEQAFLRFGPRKTSMEEIAESAGLARATLYLHFASKKKLYEALLRQITEQFVDDANQLVAGDMTAPLKFRRFVELTANTYSENPLLLAALTGNSAFALKQPAEPVMRDYRGQIQSTIKNILEQGIEERSVRVLDADITAYLLYELGTQLLVKSLNGTSDYPLKSTLDAMDTVIAKGILFAQEDLKKEQ